MTGVRQQREQRDLPDVRALARHVGPGDERDLLRRRLRVACRSAQSVPRSTICSSTGWRPSLNLKEPSLPMCGWQ